MADEFDLVSAHWDSLSNALQEEMDQGRLKGPTWRRMLAIHTSLCWQPWHGGSFHLDRIGLRRCRLLIAAAKLVRRGHTSSPFPALCAWHHQCGGRRGGVQADLAVLHCRRVTLGAAASHDGQESKSHSCVGHKGARGSVRRSSMHRCWLFALDRGLLGCEACCSASVPS